MSEYKHKIDPMPCKTLLDEIGDGISQYYLNRFAGNWKKEEAWELIKSFFKGIHIGDVYLAEIGDNTFLFDGRHRTYYLKQFRSGNMRLGKKMENSIIKYKQKVKDENGKFMKDENGNFIFEDAEFDIAGHTFEELPKELRTYFDKSSIKILTYQNCTFDQINELIRLVNNHTPMNMNQKAFARIPKFGMKINDIGDQYIFREYFDPKCKIKGENQRIIMDSVMLIFHKDNWKKNFLQQSDYINENASDGEFDYVAEINRRLYIITDGDTEYIFTKKNTILWFALFAKFDKLNLPDERFKDFVKEFKKSLVHKKVKGIAFSDIDKSYSLEKDILSNVAKRSTNRVTINTKMEILETLLYDYLETQPGESAEELIETASVEENIPVEENTNNVEKAPVEERKSVYIEEVTDQFGNVIPESKEFKGFESANLKPEFYERMKQSYVIETIGYSDTDVKEIADCTMALHKNCEVSELNGEYNEVIEEDYEEIYLNTDIFDAVSLEVNLDSEFFEIENIAAMIRVCKLSVELGAKDDELIKWFVNYEIGFSSDKLTGDYKERYESLKADYERFLSFHSKNAVEIPLSAAS